MATTSARTLTLLSLLASRPRWSGEALATRLGVSARTVRRDVEVLRDLGYAVVSLQGPDGGYRLGAGSTLPPLLFDEEQAVAVAVALQTAPATVFGLEDAAARALATLQQAMPVRLRAEAEALELTSVRNPWAFAGPPIEPATLQQVGRAVRRRHLLEFDYRRPDGTRAEPGDADFVAPARVEPHHLVVWAGRWYLIAYDRRAEEWAIYRVDRIHPLTATGRSFERRPLPDADPARFVMTSHDRGDTPARWQCLGSAVITLPAPLVARWAPGGSVVEQLDATRSRLTLGAWSWAGIAGLLATFDAELSDVEPEPLRAAMGRVAARFTDLADQPA